MSASEPQTQPYRTEPPPGIPPLVDVHRPDGDPTGAVMVVHGGAFLIGHRRMTAVQRCVQAAVDAGLVAVSVDYRMVGRGGGFEVSLDDVLAALDWWRDGEGAGLPLGLWGLSAGAALAAVASAERAAAVSAVVGVYGPYDFRNLLGQPVMRWPTRLLLGTTEQPELLAASPMTRATGAAPMLLVHGRQDRLVPVWHSRRMLAARQAAGLPCELHEVDARHGYLKRTRGPGEQTLTRSVAFLRTHLSAPRQAASAAR